MNKPLVSGGLGLQTQTIWGQHIGPWPLGCTAFEHDQAGFYFCQIIKWCPANNSTCTGASSRSHCKIKTRNVFLICPWQHQTSWQRHWWEMTWEAGTCVWTYLHLKPVGNTCHYFAHLQTASEIQVANYIVQCPVCFSNTLQKSWSSFAKKWHQVTHVPASLAFSLFF